MFSSSRLLFALIVLVFFHCFSYAQSGTRRNQVKLSAMRLMDFVNPGVELSYERYYAKRMSTEVGFGYMRDFATISEQVTANKNYSGWQFSAEQKLFLRPVTEIPNAEYNICYFSLQFDRRDASYDRTGTFESVYYTDEDEFRVIKKTTCFGLKWGMQAVVGHFVADVSIGVGVKYKNVVWEGIQYPDRKLTGLSWNHRAGTYQLFNVPMNLKLGYIF